MSINKKKTSKKVATLASKILRDENSSKIAKSFAGSAMSQAGTDKQTGADLEAKASEILKSKKYNAETKTLAATVLSQSNQER